MAYFSATGTSGGTKPNCPPFIKGFIVPRYNTSVSFYAQKNDILFVNDSNGGDPTYERVISGNVEVITNWHTIYSISKQRALRVTADGIITVQDNTSTTRCQIIIISKNGEEITCTPISCSANTNVEILNVKKNELFMTFNYYNSTKIPMLPLSTENKLLQVITNDSYTPGNYGVNAPGQVSAIRSIDDYDSATVSVVSYVTEIMRFS